MNRNKHVLDKLDKFIKDNENIMLDIFKQSLQDLIESANKPVKAGGKMPVNTGFLRASSCASINSVPRGEIRGRHRVKGETGEIYKLNSSSAIIPTIIKIKTGDTFYFGWSAIYAPSMNLKYGFMDSAVQNWNRFVKKNIQKFVNYKSGFKEWSQSVRRFEK